MHLLRGAGGISSFLAHGRHGRQRSRRTRTSILSTSSFPYCFFISLLAIFIASTVAIVLRRFSVVSDACSMLNVCCWSWPIWPS